MAIFGDLQHLPFRELSHVLRPQTGTLVLDSALGGRSAELHLHGGELRALFIDGFPVRDEDNVQRTVQQLVSAGAGSFEFQPSPLNDLTSHWQLRLSDLMRVGALVPEIPEDRLPHADTRFGLGQRGGEPPKALWSAWALMQPLLLSGATAAELSQRLGFDERQVRVMLHGLRSADLIVPVRASVPVPAGRPEVSAPGPVQRFLGALRRLAGGRA